MLTFIWAYNLITFLLSVLSLQTPVIVEVSFCSPFTDNEIEEQECLLGWEHSRNQNPSLKKSLKAALFPMIIGGFEAIVMQMKQVTNYETVG